MVIYRRKEDKLQLGDMNCRKLADIWDRVKIDRWSWERTAERERKGEKKKEKRRERKRDI
jgi:hypothetical protein